MTTNVFDVSKYILNKQGSMTTMKLQKLAYYSYAWHLVWTEKSLFEQKFKAWKNGPVCYELFEQHRGNFMIAASTLNTGDESKLSTSEMESIDRVLATYGDLSGGQLSDLTHNESPWKLTREDPWALSSDNEEINDALIKDFYSNLSETGIKISDLTWPE